MIIPSCDKKTRLKFKASQKEMFYATLERLENQGYKWLVGVGWDCPNPECQFVGTYCTVDEDCGDVTSMVTIVLEAE